MAFYYIIIIISGGESTSNPFVRISQSEATERAPRLLSDKTGRRGLDRREKSSRPLPTLYPSPPCKAQSPTQLLAWI